MEIDIGAIIILAIAFVCLINSSIYYYKYTNLLNTEIRLYKELNLKKLQSLMNFKVFKPNTDGKYERLIMPVSEFLDLYNYVDNKTS